MRRAALAFVAGLLAAGSLAAPAARAAGEAPNAAINGFARGSAAYVPLNVNPNVDLWPVYSMSETDGSLSHGISAGFWPGFLVDATFFEYGYQPFERAFLGASESAYPVPPSEDESGTSDFAHDCQAGELSKVPLPFGQGSAGAPGPLLSGCEALYTQYKSHVPWSVTSSRTASAGLQSTGSALATQLRFGTVSVGQAYSTSYTDASAGGRTVSGATVILSDVSVQGTMHVGAIISQVEAIANGTPGGAKTSRTLQILDATYQGQRVTVDGNGVWSSAGKSLNGVLAQQGISLEVVPGGDKRTASQAQVDSGVLVVHAARAFSGDALGGTDSNCRALAQLQPSPVATVHQTVAPNPLASNVPPYNQLPQSVAVDSTLPPPIPCAFQLMDNSVDTGVALAGTTAVSRFQPLPPVPGFDGGDGGVIDGGTPGGFAGGPLPAGIGGPLLPGFNSVPPVSLDVIHGSPLYDELGIAAAGKVKALYGGLALMLVALVAGRRAFRYLVRP